MSAVAPQILHENVGRIWFRRKQSSPTLTRVFVTVSPSTFRESKPSVFLGRVYVVVS
jgi:hypothetical protein